jgi:tetratricopeptide (TPR) repeat protein
MSNDSRQILNEIFASIKAGTIDDAEALCRKALEKEPDDINILGMFGAILLKSGQNDEAEATLRRTIELEPRFAKPHEDLGVLYLGQSNAEKALQFLERAVALNPDEASAHRLMAVALRQLGRPAEAEAAHRRFISLAPGADPLGEAEVHRNRGNPAQAEQICQGLLKREPENIGALRMLAVIAMDDKRHVIAEGLFRRIVSLAPASAKALSDLGRCLGEQSRFPEAIEALQQATAIADSDPKVWRALGDMLAIMNRPNDALEAYERCLEVSPDELAALAGRGHMLRIVGRAEEAIATYRQAVDARPDAGDGWWNLASLHGYRFNDGNVEEMQELAASADMAPESLVSLRFALARALEQRSDYDGAWAQYSMANGLKRSQVKYDPVETEVTHRKIRDTFTADLLGERMATPPTDQTPCFIVGMPRSGSTLIEQILASHSAVYGSGELPYINMLTHSLRVERDERLRYPEVARELFETQLTGLGRSYLHYAATGRDGEQPFFTDKMPANFSHVGFIHMILPHAKIIDARRHPLATCIANYRYLFAQGKNYTYDLAELAEYYLLYDEIMQHWDEVLPGKVLHVQYEDMIGDAPGQVRRILEFCELPFEDACLNFYRSERPVNTASSEQVRQPIYDSAVEFWKNYESHLDELKEILAPVL